MYYVFRAVIHRQSATTEQLYRHIVVPNTADRGSVVAQTSLNLMTKGWGGCLALYIVNYSMLYSVHCTVLLCKSVETNEIAAIGIIYG